MKLKDQDLRATDRAKKVAIEVLSRARNRPNFGNIGDVENLLSKAKGRYQTRQASLPSERRSPAAPFEPPDFDPEFDRSENAASNLEKLFEDVVGCEEVVKKLGRWQRMARMLKARDMDASKFIPTNFVFKGPPGENKVLGWPRTQPCSIGGSLRIISPFQIQASSSSGSLFSTILA